MEFDLGDHIIAYRVGYSHHGIYAGDDRVVHYLNDGVTDDSLDIFKSNMPTRKALHPIRKYSTKETVTRAYSRLGEDKYNVVFNNCEHFANWCINGLHSSDQVAFALAAIEKIYLELYEAKKVPEGVILLLEKSPHLASHFINIFGKKEILNAINIFAPQLKTIIFGATAASLTPGVVATATGTGTAIKAATSIATGTTVAAITATTTTSVAAGVAGLVGTAAITTVAAPVVIGVAACVGVYKLLKFWED